MYGDIYRATVECHFADTGVQLNNVFWFQQTSTNPVTAEETYLGLKLSLAIAHTGAFDCSGWRDIQSTNIVYDQVRVQRMVPTHDAPWLVPFATGVAGSNSNASMPAPLALVLKLQTATAGRSGTGRIYLGGIRVAFTTPTNADFDSGRWKGGVLTQALLFGTQMLTVFAGGVADGSFAWGVWSHKFGNRFPPFNAAGFRQINAGTTDGVIRVQRRREFGYGA